MSGKQIHIHIHGTRDAWNESDHPRADNGQFGQGSGGGAKGGEKKSTHSSTLSGLSTVSEVEEYVEKHQRAQHKAGKPYQNEELEREAAARIKAIKQGRHGGEKSTSSGTAAKKGAPHMNSEAGLHEAAAKQYAKDPERAKTHSEAAKHYREAGEWINEAHRARQQGDEDKAAKFERMAETYYNAAEKFAAKGRQAAMR